jgi:hypothetical protein
MDLFSAFLLKEFLRFCWSFGDFSMLRDGFLWSGCDELCGKRGLLDVDF